MDSRRGRYHLGCERGGEIMGTSDTAATERAWLEAVGERLGALTGSATIPPPADTDVRSLLRVTKITADVTGVRYLAPLTAYLIGIAAGRADVFDLKKAVEEINRLAEGWARPED
jgi:hypothetical protein